MIYSIYMDGVRIYDETEDLSLIDSKLTMELNSAGSLEFTIPVEHTYYDLPKPLTSDVEVRENDEIIWFGRVKEINIDFYNKKHIYCEGALAYLNDSIQRPYVYDDGDQTIEQFFDDLITNHNEQVNADRKFKIGEVEVNETYIYRKLNYEGTLNAIQTMCIDAEGGYLFLRRIGDTNYIDWLREVPYSGSQPLQFAVNITDMTQTFDYGDLITCVIPIGEEDETTGEIITCAEANNGYDYVLSDLADTFGRISKAVQFSGIKDPAELVDAAKRWLEDEQFDPWTIEIDSAELSYLNDGYTAFKLGQKIEVLSTPHGINKVFPIIKMEMELDSPTKSITIGNIKKKKLTEIYKEE